MDYIHSMIIAWSIIGIIISSMKACVVTSNNTMGADMVAEAS